MSGARRGSTSLTTELVSVTLAVISAQQLGNAHKFGAVSRRGSQASPGVPRMSLVSRVSSQEHRVSPVRWESQERMVISPSRDAIETS